MRLMSFQLTTTQIRNRTKTVTRRLGWENLKPGTLLMACEKVMGRQGKPLVRLAVIVVTMVTRESVAVTSNADAAREGFPELTGREFAHMFCSTMSCEFSTTVTRIEFRYVPGGRIDATA